MKVSVLGAGAIGSMLGGLLQRDAPDLEVVLVARGDHGCTIAGRGKLILDGPWGTREVPIVASADSAAVAGSRFVFITVKSQDSESAAGEAARHWGDATVVSIQNGINDKRLAPLVAPGRLVMGMTATNMVLVEPGRVSLQLGGATILGPSAGESTNKLDMTAAAAAAALLSQIRWPSLTFLAHPNAVGARYNKLAINALGYASCLSASNFITDALANTNWRQTVGQPIVTECRSAFDLSGITLERIPGVPSLPKLQRLMRLMDSPLVGPVVSFGARRLFNRRPIKFSLHQDLERGKPTEVDFVNGEIVRLAQSQGIDAPANALVAQMVQELASRGDHTFFSRAEVIRRFGSVRATI